MSRRGGFTLLEVVIALTILATALFVLVESQASAVLMTQDGARTATGSYLAQQKMTEALLRLEKEGFRESDVDEQGDFEDFGDVGLAEQVDFGDAYDGYSWAYTIRRVNLALGDVAGSAEQLQAVGLGPSEEATQASGTNPLNGDLGMLGVQPDTISDELAKYIREVRVTVWWGEEPKSDEACVDCIELVTHVANPSGTIFGSEVEE